MDSIALDRPGAGNGMARPAYMQALMVIAAILLWEVLARSGIFYHGVFPSILVILSALGRLLASATFYWHLGVTVMEVLLALAIGGVVGGVVGFLFGVSSFMSRAFENYVYYISATPKIIFFPLVITWFGIDSGSKIGLGAIAAFFPMCLNIATGIRGINPIWVRAARSYRASFWQMLWKVYLPGTRPALLTALRLALAVTLVSVLLAETKLAKNGLGFLVDGAYSRYDMPTMYALILFIFCVSVGINLALTRWIGETSQQSFV
ncbi:MAG TPA: ABC transporter permease subunit [Rhizobiaceae bacterium]|nr:ABC transporter permease subunit [Rhizobiaceae bacterium]